MLSVLTVSTLYPGPGKPGFGAFIARQTEGLAALADVSVRVVNPVPVLPPMARFARPSADAADGQPAVYRPRFDHVPAAGWRWDAAAITRACLPLVRQLHAEQPINVIDGEFFFPCGVAAARIGAALGIPVSIKARGSDIHFWGRKPPARAAMLAAAAQAGGLLAVSAALRADMVSLGMPAGRIQVHYTGVDLARFGHRDRPTARLELQDRYGIAQDAPLVASIGNLVPLKRHAAAIAAAAQAPWQLAIAGDGPERVRLDAMIRQHGLERRVHLLGRLAPTDIATLLAGADVLLHCSQREGLANVWVEALAAGTPVITTAVGGAAEVIDDPALGRLLPDVAPDAIRKAVAALMADPPDPAGLRARAADFSWQRNAAALRAHLRTVAGTNR